MILRKKRGVRAMPPPKRGGWGAKPPSLGCFCAYIGGRQGISAPFILPTQNLQFPAVVPLDCWVALRDYLVLLYLVPWFFTLFGVIFDVKTAKIEIELSPISRIRRNLSIHIVRFSASESPRAIYQHSQNSQFRW